MDMIAGNLVSTTLAFLRTTGPIAVVLQLVVLLAGTALFLHVLARLSEYGV